MSQLDLMLQQATPLYDRMCKTINASHTIDDGELITDPVEQLKYYAAIAKNHEPEKRAIAIRLRAEKALRKMMR